GPRPACDDPGSRIADAMLARDDEVTMPPRIRSFLPRPLFAREKKAPAPEAPRVFREFVETLQKLDAAKPQPEKRSGSARLRARRRHYNGNGVRRPSPARTRSRP